MYYTYMLRCEDNSIYTGITNNLNNRMSQHFLQNKNSAKYTKSHRPIRVEAVWKSKEKNLACKLEYHIKSLKKFEKEKLILDKKLSEFLKGRVDCRRYRSIELSKIIDEKYLFS